MRNQWSKKYIIVVMLQLVISCNDSPKETVSIDTENLFIKISDFNASPDNEFFFSKGTVYFYCSSNFPESTKVVVNKGLRLNTESAEALKKAQSHDTLLVKDNRFEVTFPAKFSAGGYISFEVLNDLQSDKVRRRMADKAAKKIDRVYYKEYSVGYKRMMNENGMNVPELPVKIEIEEVR